MDWIIWLLVVFVFSLGIALIKSFSINIPEVLKWLDDRRTRKIQEDCPHGRVLVLENPFRIKVESWFFTPSGTTMFFCRRCSIQVYEDQADFVIQQMAERVKRDASEKFNISLSFRPVVRDEHSLW